MHVNTALRLAATGTDPLSTTCTYKGQSHTFVALVTDGPKTGLADVDPRVPDAEVIDRCAGCRCKNTEVVAAVVLTDLINASTG